MSNQRPITRIVVAGHVDHGKSTLVGRLAYETGSLSDGKDKALAAMADRRGMGFEWAFLVDAMQAERDQGVTIDTAQIWLRGIGAGGADIVMIDAPGHKEFLKNMITGAAQADGALLVIDAAEGLGEQSRRHAYLLHLLGVQKVIVAVNKMDLAGFQQDRFRSIAAEMGAYLAEIGLEALAILPVAARDGDGIARPSPRMGWSSAPSLIAALKAVEPSRRDAALPLRLPVQDVYKLDQRRIIAGRIETGTISVGDTIIVSPSNLSTKIKSLEVWPEGGPAKTQASAGESVGLTFEDQIFVERGEVLSHSADAPLESDVFRARLFWLAKEPLTPGLRLTLKLGTYEGPCEVQSIDTVVDVGTLAHGASTNVERGGVAEATLRARRVLALDEYARLPRTGRFVLTRNGAIAGGGIISMDGYADQRGLLTQRATNITRVGPAITRAERWQRNGHKGAVIWLTGLSGSGKSTLAVGLEPLLHARGLQTYVLDGDNLRHGLNADLGFSPAERAENIRRVGEVAALFADAGLVTLVSFISPYRSDRARARKAAGALFHEVHVRAALETCEARDPKGLYAKARAGQIRDFTGISAPYEAPDAPELVIDTDAGDVGRSLQTLMDYVLSAVRA